MNYRIINDYILDEKTPDENRFWEAYDLKLEKKEAIFLLCYISSIVLMYVFGDIYNKPRVLWLGCSVLTVTAYATIAIRPKLTRLDLIFRFIIIALFSVAAFVSNKPQMMMYAAFICTADLTNFKRIVTTCFFTCVAMIVLVPIADLIGIVPKREFSRGFGTAHSFGFGYYNVVPFTYFFLVLEFLYLKAIRNKKANLLEVIIIFGLNYLLYKLSTLRLAFYLVCIVLGLYIILIKFNMFNLKAKPIVIACSLIFPLLFFVSIWINSAYDVSNPLFVKLNWLLSERLDLGHQALNKYSINLFGHYIQTIRTANEYFYVDSGFLFSLLGYGLLFTGMALCIYTYLCHYAAKNNKKMLFIWLSSVAVFSVINNTWISLYMNPILLYFPIMLKNRGQENYNEFLGYLGYRKEL